MTTTRIYYSPTFEQIALVEYDEWFAEVVKHLQSANPTWHYIGDL